VLFQAKEQDKKTYEQALSWILQHEFTRLQRSISLDDANELVSLVKQLALIENDPNSPRYPLQNWESLDQMSRTFASGLTSVLLTSQNTLRKAFDHHVGLKRGCCPNKEYEQLKAASKTLLQQLEVLPDFLDALRRVKELPEPEYNMEQWDVLQALFTLLPILAAHLQLIFSEHNEVDFTSVSQQALLALGDELNPTDLALYLDHSIEHLLVDEFQDTSIQQFQLLHQLVQHWQPDDGKTLFVVGDPMQSIYRFRSAEVGLFLRAKEQGIGPVSLIPLELKTNFRSTATIVEWVNHQFPLIFPSIDDIESGAISYHASTHVKPAENNSMVRAFDYENREEEARGLVQLIITELHTNPHDDIAVLVRSRNQLTELIRCLRMQNIPFQGIDIDLLAQLPHLQDVWSLTQALLMPANRLAWLSVLYSPWCGLSLSDLHIIANVEKNKSICFALSQEEHLSELSHEGRIRARFVSTVLNDALAKRHQQSLIPWLTETLRALHLEKVLHPSEQDDLEQYWQLLERFEQDGQIEDFEAFRGEFNKLYSQQVAPSRLKIMTIHKSKGLEFDCVFLPGLSTKTISRDTPMLRWMTLPSQQHNDLLLISPMKAAHHDNCLLYHYLSQLDAEKNNYESQRLLYVAVTRAKKRLYLCDFSEKITQGTFRSLLKNQPFVSGQQEPFFDEEHQTLPRLYHLPVECYHELPSLTPPNNSSPLIMINPIPRLMGIVAHELLQWICDHHVTSVTEIPWELAHHQLKTMGFDSKALSMASNLLSQQFTAFFNDPIAQWLIEPHDKEHNEYKLQINDHHVISTKIIDRTFCDNDVRWIIDFKTGQDDKKTHQKHRKQLNDYARLFTNKEAEPKICCGVYYLANHHWVTWDYVPQEQEEVQ
jgi:ATP-dependent exoDNAse (exonuclease V) beta subunit